tara:strand:+ start:1386 stop:3737 length:2352 start_codon:yes stop_codon:yes gene_type:complete
MELNLEKFKIRKTKPIILGNAGLPDDTERYHLEGMEMIVIDVFKDDKLILFNIEGSQNCEICFFESTGKCKSLVNIDYNSEANFIKNKINEKNYGSFLEKLKKRKFDFNNLKSLNIFTKETLSGEKIEYVIEKNGFALISAPGKYMSVDSNEVATDLYVFIKRNNKKNFKQEAVVPEPLADVKSEILIKDSSAVSYEVKKGDFIQIIDLYGRQCSDFNAFDSDALQKGKEYSIDPTATRSLIGNSYPMPGLSSKFFDKNQDPLIEVMQDSIGRHDTFGTACSLKTYEDQGYFGHVNCSDNFNYSLDSFGIEKRKAWQAVNLFWNTGIDEANTFTSEMPWSRPGDYVLFQAQKDLVCVSSGCPDDIDPANDWNPTDIFVRIYSEKNKFSKSIGYRKSADSDFMLTKETGFHPRTSKLTKDMMESAGYWIPSKYNNYGSIAEYTACRENVVMMDLSSLKKFEVVGPDAEELMNTALTRNVKKLSIGQVVYSAMCYENGTMIDDGTLYRMTEHNFRWICGSDYSGEWLRELSKKLDLRAWIKSSSDQLHNISIQGPNSRKVLSKIIWTAPNQPELNDLQWFHFSISRIGDHKGVPIMVSRTGYTGELGYELYCHPKDAVSVWDAVWEAGKEFEITPMGFEALDKLRIEAGLILAGHEFSDQTDPFEAGIGFTVPLKSKEANFIGKEELIKRKNNPQKKLVGLEITGNEIAQHGDCVHIGRGQVGVVTSGTLSPSLDKNIALCRIDVKYSDLNTEVEIGKLDGHQKRIPAKVIGFPFYDPTKSRVKA